MRGMHTQINAIAGIKIWVTPMSKYPSLWVKLQIPSNVICAPWCGKESNVPAAIAAIRWMLSGEMFNVL